MELVVSLGCVGQNRVTESKSRCLELHSNARVDLGIVSVVVAVFEQTDSVLVHFLVADDNGKELIVRYVLHYSAHNASAFLENLLVVPVWIQDGQLVGHLVVLSQKDGVHHRQLQLFVGTIITGIEAEHVPAAATALTATVRIASLHRQQVFESCNEVVLGQ